MLNNAISEREFMQMVIDYARLHGFLAYHTYDSRRSEPGFPDLVLVRGDRVIVAELKAMKGGLRPGQVEWLEAFADTGKVEAFLWLPSSWDEIEEVLK